VNVLAQAVGDSAGAWVKAGVNSLTAPGNLNVVVNAANLTGSHTGSVTLTCDPSTPCPAVTVPVTVQVSTSVQTGAAVADHDFHRGREITLRRRCKPR